MSLRLYQYKGPFNYNTSDPLVKYQASPGEKIRHLGIQVPYNTPFPFVFSFEVDNGNLTDKVIKNDTDFTITLDNQGIKSYRVSPNGILEFSDLNATEITIRGNIDNPLPKEAIIDILVETE